MSVQSIVVPTPKSALPQYKDNPVPWATRWTGEVIPDPAQVSVSREGVYLRYADGKGETRDAMGVLWQREGLGRNGKPEFSQMNAYRQRACMLKRKCQVCGTKINERPIRWLMSPIQLHPIAEGEALTMSPPTCSSCIPLALELCPHLAKGHLIAKVLNYEPWGVMGQAVTIDEETGQGREQRGIYVPYVNPPIPLTSVVAKQQVVRLTKYIIEEQT